MMRLLDGCSCWELRALGGEARVLGVNVKVKVNVKLALKTGCSVPMGIRCLLEESN